MAALINKAKGLLQVTSLAIFLIPWSMQLPAPILGASRLLGRGTINALAWSHDGKTLAVGSGAGIWLYDGQHLDAEPQLITDPSGAIENLTFSPDDKLLAYGVRDQGYIGTLKLWDFASGRVVHSLHGLLSSELGDNPHVELNNVAFSPDGKLLAYGRGVFEQNRLTKQFISMFDVSSENYSAYIDWPPDVPIGGLAFSPDGKLLAASTPWTTTSALWLWDASNWQLLRSFGKQGAFNIDFSPDSRTLASSSYNEVNLWDVSTGQIQRTFKAPEGVQEMSVRFSPDGKQLLATDGNAGMLQVWDAASGKLLKKRADEMNMYRGPATNAVFSPDGNSVAYVGQDSTVNIWNLAANTITHRLAGYSAHVSRVAFSPDSKSIAAELFFNTVQLWDVERGQSVRIVNPPATNALVGVGNGGKVLSLLSGNTPRLVDVDSQRVQNNISTYSLFDSQLAVSADGKLLAATLDDKIQVWDVKTRRILSTLKDHVNSEPQLTFSPDGKLLASNSIIDSQIQFWDVASGKALHTISAPGTRFNCMVFFPDSETLVVGQGNGSVSFWDVQTWQNVRTLHTLPAPAGSKKPHLDVQSVAISPDGKWLAAGDYDGGISLWNLGSGQLVQTIQENSDVVNSVTFSPDGRYLAAGGFDGTVRLWSMPG